MEEEIWIMVEAMNSALLHAVDLWRRGMELKFGFLCSNIT